MAKIELYTADWCGHCVRAKMLLQQRGLPFEEIHVDKQPGFREKLEELTGHWTVPQIVIDGRPIGGYAELHELDVSGQLASLAA